MMRANSEEIGSHLRSISMLFALRCNQFTCVCALEVGEGRLKLALLTRIVARAAIPTR